MEESFGWVSFPSEVILLRCRCLSVSSSLIKLRKLAGDTNSLEHSGLMPLELSKPGGSNGSPNNANLEPV